MCEPLSLTSSALFYTSLAVSAAQGVMQYVGQQNVAEAQQQVAAINQQQREEAAARDLALKSADLNTREAQETEASSLRTFNQNLQARRAASTAIASSDSAGASFDALLADYDRQAVNLEQAELTQLGFTKEQIERSRQGLQYEYASRAAGQAVSVSQPSIVGTAAGVIGDGFKAYNTFSTIDPDTGNRTF